MKTNTMMNNVNYKLQSAIDNIRARRFIVGSVDKDGNFSISSNPAIHVGLVSANQEADRLSAANPGKVFVPMQLCGGSVASAVTRF